ncbi:YbhB/YbcL family Raf kinase inhibitor-like protein [Halocatena pleomorpha]|nr:YbhB/YbcL family Raf kinase inhibitor-like protein [Halocatena pleomorpha]
MRTRRQVLGTVVTMTVLAGCSSETEQDPSPGLFAPAFSDGSIPAQHTCDGSNSSPEIEISDVARETESLALVMVDADVPSPEPYVHWLIWNIPPDTAVLPSGIPQRATVSLSERGTDPGFPDSGTNGPIVQGTNSANEIGYTGPCPPRGDGPHTYAFTLYSLTSMLTVNPGATWADLKTAMQDQRLGSATLTATYER